ncbi:MAG TPA: hypothetical protein V6D17_21665 [Candidatus Obscuribacterales bacterium]
MPPNIAKQKDLGSPASVKGEEPRHVPARPFAFENLAKGNHGLWSLCLMGLFALVALITLRQNLSLTNLNVAALFDSGIYLQTTGLIVDGVNQVLKCKDTTDHVIQRLGEPLLLNGPVLPAAGALYFLLVNKAPNVMDMRAAIVLQSLLHALSAIIMALLLLRATGKRQWAIAGGLVWGFYPAAVIGAGKFMSETIVTLFSLGWLLSLSFVMKSENAEDVCAQSSAEAQVKDGTHKPARPEGEEISPVACACMGFLSSALMLLKPALAPGILFALLTAGAVITAKIVDLAKPFKMVVCLKSIPAFLFGTGLLLCPWLLFTHEATGTYILTPQRMPVFNIVSGLDAMTDGWASLPDKGLVRLFSERDSSSAAFFAVFKQAPEECTLRLLRKIPRLFVNPWNDCRLSFLFLSPPMQAFWHQILLCLGLIGLVSILARKVSSAATVLVPLCGVIFLGAHLVYLPFVANVRYGFTGMPMIVLLAVYALSSLSTKGRLTKWLALAVSTASFVTLLHLPEALPGSLFSVPPGMTSSINISFRFVLLTIFGAATFFALRESSIASKRGLMVACLVLTFFGAAVSSAVSNSQSFGNEFSARISKSSKAVRAIVLPEALIKPEWALVLIDCDSRAATSARLSVNGSPLPSRANSIIHYIGNRELPNNYRVFADVIRKQANDLRQWRVFEVPVETLRFGGKNVLELSAAGEDFTLFGSFPCDKAPSISAPSLNIFSPSKLLNGPCGLDPRLMERFPKSINNAICSLATSRGQETFDLSQEIGVQRGQYRIFLVVGHGGKTASPNKGGNQKAVEETSPVSGSCIKLANSQSWLTPIPSRSLTKRNLRIKIRAKLGSAESSDVGRRSKPKATIGSEPPKTRIKMYIKDQTLLGAVLALEAREGSWERRKDMWQAEALVGTHALKPDGNMLEVAFTSFEKNCEVSNLVIEFEPYDGPTLASRNLACF